MSRPNPVIYGFTLLRNGVKYDYPFLETLHSLNPICNNIVIALGKGEDETEAKLKSLQKISLVHTEWDEKLRSGGLILSQQTNVALNALRQSCQQLAHAWGIYLQCDEVLHEDDRDLIVQDIERAEREGADTIAFRYLHFWQEHDALAINKKWYPHEIRAIKLASTIESWGDAQSFRGNKKIFYSEARVFHYGHVREADKYKVKKADILKLYHSDQKLAKYKRREKRFDDQTRTLDYLGGHPQVMKDRIIRLGGEWDHLKAPVVTVLADKKIFSPAFLASINAQEVRFIDRRSDTSNSGPFIDYSDTEVVPIRMESKLARPWNADFRLSLMLSAAGVSAGARD